MSNNYSWKINYFITEERPNYPKLATIANFTLTATDPANTVSYQYEGNVGIQTDNLDPNSYLPFDQLTETVAVGWIMSTLGIEGVKQITALADGRIAVLLEQAANPPQFLVTRLPWAPEAGWDDKPYSPFNPNV